MTRLRARRASSSTARTWISQSSSDGTANGNLQINALGRPSCGYPQFFVGRDWRLPLLVIFDPFVHRCWRVCLTQTACECQRRPELPPPGSRGPAGQANEGHGPPRWSSQERGLQTPRPPTSCCDASAPAEVIRLVSPFSEAQCPNWALAGRISQPAINGWKNSSPGTCSPLLIDSSRDALPAVTAQYVSVFSATPTSHPLQGMAADVLRALLCQLGASAPQFALRFEPAIVSPASIAQPYSTE